jgi:hypothetical protein
MPTARGRFGSISVQGDFVVIHHKGSIVGSEDVSVHRANIQAINKGKLGLGERFVRFAVPGAPPVMRKGRSGVVGDRYALIYWSWQESEVDAVLRAIRG